MYNVEFAKAAFGGYRTEDVDSYVGDLQKHILDLEDAESKLSEQVSRFKQEADALRNEKENAEERLSQLKGEVVKLEMQTRLANEDNTQKLAAAEAEIRSLKGDLQRLSDLQSENRTLEQNLSNVQEQKRGAEQLLEASKAEVNALKDEIQRLSQAQQQSQGSEKELADAKQELSDVKRELSDAKRDLANAKQESSEARDEINKLKNEVQRLSKVSHQNQDQNQVNPKVLEEAKAEIKALKDEVQRLSGLKKQNADIRAHYESQLKRANETIVHLEEQAISRADRVCGFIDICEHYLDI